MLVIYELGYYFIIDSWFSFCLLFILWNYSYNMVFPHWVSTAPNLFSNTNKYTSVFYCWYRKTSFFRQVSTKPFVYSLKWWLSSNRELTKDGLVFLYRIRRNFFFLYWAAVLSSKLLNQEKNSMIVVRKMNCHSIELAIVAGILQSVISIRMVW